MITWNNQKCIVRHPDIELFKPHNGRLVYRPSCGYNKMYPSSSLSQCSETVDTAAVAAAAAAATRLPMPRHPLADGDILCLTIAYLHTTIYTTTMYCHANRLVYSRHKIHGPTEHM
jgi:hypothetical protein